MGVFVDSSARTSDGRAESPETETEIEAEAETETAEGHV